MAASLTQKIGLASLILLVSVFLSRIMGIVREMAIAFVGGAGREVDAYQIAFVIPELLNHAVASGFLSITFIPIFSRCMARNQENRGWQILSNILFTYGAFLLLLAIFAHWQAPYLVDLLARGRQTDTELLHAATRMTRIIIPAQLFFFAGSLFMAVQFAKGRFFIPALAPLIYNLGIILGGLLLGHHWGMEGFCWGVLAGAFAGNFLVQWFGARRVGLKIGFVFRPLDADLLRYGRLTLPLMLGFSMIFSTELFVRIFGAYLPNGSIAALNYGLRIMLAVVAVFGQVAGVAAFPYLSKLAAEKRHNEMNRLLNDTLLYLGLVIPFATMVMVLRFEVVQLLFERGRFDTAATEVTAGLLVYLLVGAAAFAAQTVVPRGFYAQQNTWLPALLTTGAVLLSLPLYVAGMHWMGVRGVAAVISLSAILQVLVLYWIWNRRNANADGGQVYRFYGKMVLLSVPLGLVCEGIRKALQLWLPEPSSLTSAATLLLIVPIYTALLLFIGFALRIEEITGLPTRIYARIFKRSA